MGLARRGGYVRAGWAGDSLDPQRLTFLARDANDAHAMVNQRRIARAVSTGAACVRGKGRRRRLRVAVLAPEGASRVEVAMKV